MLGRDKQPSARGVLAFSSLAVAFVLLLHVFNQIQYIPLPARLATAHDRRRVSPKAEEDGQDSKYGCKHYYFDLGTNNALSIADFINNSATDKRGNVVRPHNLYREKEKLDMTEFCVFGFEPNPMHSANHRQVERKYGPGVRHVEIFSRSIAGIKDGTSILQVDNFQGEFPSWGSSVMSGFGPIAKQGNTTSVQVKSIDFGRFVLEMLNDQIAPGKVIVRMDIEGSEYILLRRFMDVVCKYVDFLEVEWHARHLSPPPYCVESTLKWMLSDERCKPRWSKPVDPRGCNPWKISDAFSG
jgi:hypothetical protein